MLERGVLQGGGGLRPPAEGKAVRIRRRQLILSDGPFAETKEQIGGFCLIDAAFRDEWCRVVATLIRVTGDWDLAEECAQDAFAMALQRWPADGVPRRPGAWLTTAARNRAIDVLRRRTVGAAKLREVAALSVDPEPSPAYESDHSGVSDDRLRLIFTCCHPALSLE